VQCSPRLAPDSGDHSEQWATIVVGRLGSGIDVSRVIPTLRITDAERPLISARLRKPFAILPTIKKADAFAPASKRRTSLEREPCSELALERARQRRAGRIDESGRRPEVRRVLDVIVIVVAIVCAICKVQELCNQLQIARLAKLEVFRQPGVQLEELIATKRIEFRNRALLGVIETILRPGIITAEC